MKLVDDVHLLWRRWSTRIAAAQAGLVLFWTGLPDDWRARSTRLDHGISHWMIWRRAFGWRGRIDEAG